VAPDETGRAGDENRAQPGQPIIGRRGFRRAAPKLS
jgi:hypothetical protein